MRPFSRGVGSIKHKNYKEQLGAVDVICKAHCKMKVQVLSSKSVKNFKATANH